METILVWLILSFIFLPILLWILWSWNELRFVVPLRLSSSGFMIPPGHLGWPFFGELLNFLWYFKILNLPEDFINSRRKRYGAGVGMFRTHLFGSPSIITCSPAINKFVLQSDDLFKISWPCPDLLGHNSLVIVQGEPHKRLRRYVMEAINRPESIKQIILRVQPLIVSTLQSWAAKGRIKANDEVQKVTFENICMIFSSIEPGPFTKELSQLYRGLVAGLRAQPFNFPGTAFHHALKCRKKLTAVFKAELNKRKQTKNESREAKDLMQGLMNTTDEEGMKLGDDEVVDNIVSLVVAGYESTSISALWALYYLAKFPNVLKRLQEENLEINKQKKGDFITIDDIKMMKYTSKVVEETIRMANIAPFLFRTALQDVDFKGYRIPKGWKVIVWLRCLHIDPNYYQNPFVFNPDRWNEPPKTGTYQVFGGGMRICPGNTLVRMQLAILLHHLSLGYKWDLINPNAKIRYLPHPRPVDGAEIQFHAIQKA